MAGPAEHRAKAERLVKQARDAEAGQDWQEGRRLREQAVIHTRVARELERRRR